MNEKDFCTIIFYANMKAVQAWLQKKFILKSSIFVIILVCFYCFKQYSVTKTNLTLNENENNQLFLKKISSKSHLIKKTNLCFETAFNSWTNHSTNSWFELSNLVKDCSREIINFIPHVESTPNSPEHKHYMIPRAMWINDPCYVITFGVGGEIDAEQHIKRSLPQCKFLGFDPNNDYRSLFENGLKGSFVQTAVSGKSGIKTIYKLKDDRYVKARMTKVKSAAELIETYHGKEKIIDILSIDVEGSEYSIFESIVKDKVFKNVCQINVEIHPVWYHETGYSFYDVIKIFQNLNEAGTFIWIQADVHYHQFFVAYFVNVNNEECIEKYLKDRLL